MSDIKNSLDWSIAMDYQDLYYDAEYRNHELLQEIKKITNTLRTVKGYLRRSQPLSQMDIETQVTETITHAEQLQLCKDD